MKNFTVLVGNDINNVIKGHSWADLLEELTRYLSVSVNFPPDKPFPLAYEEIHFKTLKNKIYIDKDIKKFVAKHVLDMNTGPIHQCIMELDCENILTTNYDLSLEKVFSTAPDTLKNEGFIKESLYSIFRHHISGSKKIWHIHGSANTPQSITLGYEHYSGYLQSMRNYVVSGTKDSYKKRSFKPLTKRIKTDDIENISWLDVFFTKDVHILGLSLDFNETDLWWLLTYREKAKHNNLCPIKNDIYYYIPREFINSSQSKIDLLLSLGVNIVEQSGYHDNKITYYSNLISHIHEQYV